VLQLAFKIAGATMTSMPVTPRKKPRQRRSKETVEVLLQATAQVLVRDGYDKLSTNRIAKAAGVSVGSLYQYFPNKEALVLELARRHNQRMLQGLTEHIQAMVDAPLADAVRTYVQATIATHRQEPALDRVLTIQLLTMGLKIIEENQTQARALVKAYLQAHVDELLTTNLDMAAWMLVTLVESAVHGALLERASLLDEPAFEEELVSVVVRYLVGGAN
jgi:AcrR family transcriptional regulator